MKLRIFTFMLYNEVFESVDNMYEGLQQFIRRYQ